MFVDIVKINLQAGAGGAGLVSFRREKYVDRGGPDGGDGGSGGSISLQASRNVYDLNAYRFQKTIKAAAGQPGGRARRRGRSGADIVLKVPIGTVVSDRQTGAVVVDFTTDQQTAVLAQGGAGGFGNAHFKSSRRQTPRFAEKGLPGQSRQIQCELKLIAEAGLVGLPNAGKSTFLQATTAARPKIGAYPFTTLRPHLGVTSNGCLLADIPGLIAGAAQGKGLGYDFLRHLERNLVLLHLIDCQQPEPAVAYEQICQELRSYSPQLGALPQLVVLTKTDTCSEAELEAVISELQASLPPQTPLYHISALAGRNLKPLLRDLKHSINQRRQQLKQQAQQRSAKQPLAVFKLPGASNYFKVKRQSASAFLIRGRKIENFALKTDFENEQARYRLVDIMQKMGIVRELYRQGYQTEKLVFGRRQHGGWSLQQLTQTLEED